MEILREMITHRNTPIFTFELNSNVLEKVFEMGMTLFLPVSVLFLLFPVFCAPFWTHVREFWERKDRGDILFLTYEEMQKVSELNLHFLEMSVCPVSPNARILQVSHFVRIFQP